MADRNTADDAVDFNLVIHHNVVSKSFDMSGHSKNLLVTEGMLRYALRLVSMEIARARMVEEMKNAPRVAIPGGFPQ